MPKFNDELKLLTDQLKQQRDELKLQLHLAKEDAKVEFEKLEDTWVKLSNKISHITEGAEESKKEILDAAQHLADEIKKGYDNIKSKF